MAETPRSRGGIGLHLQIAIVTAPRPRVGRGRVEIGGFWRSLVEHESAGQGHFRALTDTACSP